MASRGTAWVAGIAWHRVAGQGPALPAVGRELPPVCVAPRPMPILGNAEFDAANPPRILATMLDVVRSAEHPLSEDGVVGRT